MRLFVIAALAALLCALCAQYVLEPILKRLSARQTINELGPQNHKSKQGALTMGGMGFLPVGALLTILFSLIWKGGIPLPLLFSVVCMLLFGAIGFYDDYLKVVRQRSVGLSAKQKMLIQLLAALIMTLITIFLPFTSWIEMILPASKFGLASQISATHIIFNITITVVLLPFSGWIEKLTPLSAGNSV